VVGPVSGDVVLIISNKITSDTYNSAEEFLYYNEKWERIGSINDWSRVSKLEASLKELEDTVNNLSTKQLAMNASLTALSNRLNTEITEEKNARIAADETADAALNAEISARQNGDNALQQSLQQEVSTLTNALNE
jgi:predicted transcriptional regulator